MSRKQAIGEETARLHLKYAAMRVRHLYYRKHKFRCGVEVLRRDETAVKSSKLGRREADMYGVKISRKQASARGYLMPRIVHEPTRRLQNPMPCLVVGSADSRRETDYSDLRLVRANC